MKFLKINADEDYLLIPDLLWDGIGDKPLKDHAVFITGGLISRLVPMSSLGENIIEGAELVRMEGTTLMPGLIDCHIHLSMNSESLSQAVDEWENRPVLAERHACQAAADFPVNGVLAVRDGSDKTGIGLTVRNKILSGLAPGPLVVATGRAVYKKGRYGIFLGPGIRTTDEALKQVEGLKTEGVDQLKVVVSGLVSFKELGVVGPSQFSISELKVIVDYAHHLGLKVMAHASSAEAVEVSARAGVDSVEHGYFLGTKQLELMAINGTAWVPTLAPLGNLVFSNYLPYGGADMDVIRRSFDIQLSRLKEAVELGVSVGIGTDAGANRVLHGYSYHDELRYYSMAGLSNMIILKMATSVSAEIIGQKGQLGAVSAGRKPYLISLLGNPLESLGFLCSPEWVIMPG